MVRTQGWARPLGDEAALSSLSRGAAEARRGCARHVCGERVEVSAAKAAERGDEHFE